MSTFIILLARLSVQSARCDGLFCAIVNDKWDRFDDMQDKDLGWKREGDASALFAKYIVNIEDTSLFAIFVSEITITAKCSGGLLGLF